MVLTTLLTAVQAPLTDKDTALSAGTWAFVRSFGAIWGVSIPAAIFNSRASSLSHDVVNEVARKALARGGAYSHASRDFLSILDPITHDQVISVFTSSLRWIWIVATVLSGVSFFSVFVEEEIELRKENDTEFGMKDAEGEMAKEV